MKYSDPRSRQHNEGQFSEASSIDTAPSRSIPVSKSQPSLLLRLALMQGFGTAVFSLAMLYCFDASEAWSALFGGSIAMTGSLYSAGRLFTTKQDAAAVEMLARFYASVVLKIVFTLVMMVICMTVLKVSVLPFIIAYLIAAVIVNWLILLVPARLDEID